MNDCRRSRVSSTPSASPGAPIVLSWALKFRSWMALDRVTLAANPHSARSEISGTTNRTASMSRIDRVRAGCAGESITPLALDLKGYADAGEVSLSQRHRALWAQTNREPGRLGLARKDRSIAFDEGVAILVVLEQLRRDVVTPAVRDTEVLGHRHLHWPPPPPAGKTSGRLSMPTRPAGQVALGVLPGASSYSGDRKSTRLNSS